MPRSIVIVFFASFFLLQNPAAREVRFTSVNSNRIDWRSNADSAWAWVNEPLWGLKSKDDAGKLYGWSSLKFYVWEELRARQYRERGIEFFESFWGDSRFKDWMDKTLGSIPPQYYKEPEAGGESSSSYLTKGTPYVAEFDEGAERWWEDKAMTLLKKYFEDGWIKEEDKKSLLGSLLTNKIDFLYRMMYLSKGDIGKKLSENALWVKQLLEEALNSSDAGNAGYILKVAANDPGLEKEVLSLVRQSKDSVVRSIAFNHEEIYRRFEATPLNLKVKSLTGGTIDFSKQRGKVILVANWNIWCGSCIAHMPLFERLYEQFQKDGFNLVGLCSIWYGQTDLNNKVVTKEGVRSKAVQMTRDHHLTYPSAVINYGKSGQVPEPDSKNIDAYFGETGGGVLYLFDQQGRLVATNSATALNGQWLEYHIRKLLNLPLDQTGK